jgi:hypothetical protein
MIYYRGLFSKTGFQDSLKVAVLVISKLASKAGFSSVLFPKYFPE